MQRVQNVSKRVRGSARITSAHAESTVRLTLLFLVVEDHLCACREYYNAWQWTSGAKGSPLRMQRVLKMSDR